MGVECLVISLGTESRYKAAHLDSVGFKHLLPIQLRELADSYSIKFL